MPNYESRPATRSHVAAYVPHRTGVELPAIQMSFRVNCGHQVRVLNPELEPKIEAGWDRKLRSGPPISL